MDGTQGQWDKKQQNAWSESSKKGTLVHVLKYDQEGV